MFEFFSENELISHNQLGYKPGNLCINQLLCITHDIYQSLDDGLETRAVFLDISKAFDNVWRKGNLLIVITNFLYHRKQRVVLNEQQSICSWPIILSDLYQ